MAETSDTAFQDKVESISLSIIGYSFLAGALFVGYQCFQWLKTGVWPELPLVYLFIWLQIDISSISNMQWEGIKKILTWLLIETPLSLFTVGAGVVIGVLFKEACLAWLTPNKPTSNDL